MRSSVGQQQRQNYQQLQQQQNDLNLNDVSK